MSEKYEYETKTIRGTYGTYFGESIDQPLQRTYVSKKRLAADVVHGDHHSPLPYGSQTIKVVTNEPSEFKEELVPFYRLVHQGLLTDRISMDKWNINMSEDLFNARNRAKTECLLKLSSNKMQLAADLAEAVKTNDMVASLASDLARSLIAFKRGNFGEVARQLGLTGRELASGATVSKRWLEYMYGWKPLYQSCHDLAQKAFEDSKDKDMIVYAKSSSPVSKSIEYVEDGVRFTETAKGGVKTQLSATISSPFIANLSELGIINPLSVAWELMPYSFVVDWFIPVGNYLEAWSSLAGLSFRAGFSSALLRYTSDSRNEPSPNMLSSAHLSMERTDFGREVFFTAPLPELYTKDNPFSTTHVLNALALIRQLR